MGKTFNRTHTPTENQLHVVAAIAAAAERRALRAYPNRLSTAARRQRTRDRVADMFPSHHERVEAARAERARGDRCYRLRLVGHKGASADAVR